MKIKWCILLLSICLLPVKWGRASEAKTVYFRSDASAEPFPVTVILPTDYNAQRSTAYPLLVTTAGDSRFEVLKAQVHWLSHVSFGPMPKVVILRLPNFDNASADKKQSEISATTFHQQVLPFVRQSFNIAPFTLLEGFSTRANLALDMLSQFPQAYQASIISSPALELESAKWNNRLLAELKQQQTHKLYIAYGSFNGQRAEFDSLFNGLTAQPNKVLSDLEAENYISTPLIHFETSVRQLFLPLSVQNFELYSAQGVQGILAYHQSLQAEFGYVISANVNLEGLANYYLENDSVEKGLAVFQYIIESAPDEQLYSVRYGQALLRVGRFEKAQQVLENAMVQAKKAQDDEAINYIQHLLQQASQHGRG